jgi:hypothetical protein
VTDTVAAEVLEISCESFRQRLARARRDLHNFMNNMCGLVNQPKPCRSAKKTRGSHLDPENLLFFRDRMGQVREAVPKAYKTIIIRALTISVRISTAGTHSINRQIWDKEYDNWSRAPISDARPICPEKDKAKTPL